MLHAKYQYFSPYGLTQEDLKRFPSLTHSHTMTPFDAFGKQAF